LELIDGHLRAEVTPEALVPVLVLDVTEAEADKILLTHDPLGAMAGSDAGQLDALLRRVNTGCAEVQQLLADVADDAGLYTTDEPRELATELPDSYQVVIECATEREQRELYEELREEG